MCGRFHYFNYLKEIDRAGLLGKCYCAHKLGDTRSVLSSSAKVNIWPKEYLVQGHGRLLGDRFSSTAYPIYAMVWCLGTLACWEPANVLHIMAHGVGLPIIARARRDGSAVLAEAVNTHPGNQKKILAEEADRLGIGGRKVRLDRREERLLEEIHLADRILVPTETVRRSFVQHGTTPAKMVKIPYGANLARFSPRQPDEPCPPPQGPLKVICVGAIGLRKGQVNLLEACRRLGPNAVELTLVGAVSKEVAPLLRRYTGSFHHIERVANSELRALLIQHEVFVLPSLEEGLAVANCEAMASGLAIVTTRESGAEEFIVDGENGLFIRPGVIDDIMDRLQYFVDHREMVDVLGRRAAETTADHLNWNGYADRLIEVYRELGCQLPMPASSSGASAAVMRSNEGRGWSFAIENDGTLRH